MGKGLTALERVFSRLGAEKGDKCKACMQTNAKMRKLLKLLQKSYRLPLPRQKTHQLRPRRNAGKHQQHGRTKDQGSTRDSTNHAITGLRTNPSSSPTRRRGGNIKGKQGYRMCRENNFFFFTSGGK